MLNAQLPALRKYTIECDKHEIYSYTGISFMNDLK
jgi:hypothetical protein